MSMTIATSDRFAYVAKLAERPELCRMAGCFNGCWDWVEGVPNAFRIRLFDANMVNLTLQDLAEGAQPGLDWKLENKQHKARLHADPLKDPVQFEEVYNMLHHLNFGPCNLKSSNAVSPLTRLDKVEAIVQDLLQAVQDSNQASKRVKN